MGPVFRYAIELALLSWTDLLLLAVTTMMVYGAVDDLRSACAMVQFVSGLGDRIAIIWEGTDHPPFPVSQLRVNPRQLPWLCNLRLDIHGFSGL